MKGLLAESEVVLFYVDGNPIGYYAYEEKSDSSAEIVGVVVIPEYQRKGLGSRVVKKILEKLKVKTTIKVVTHPQNIPALKLYFKFGFVITDLKKDYYGKGQTRLILYRGCK